MHILVEFGRQVAGFCSLRATDGQTDKHQLTAAYGLEDRHLPGRLTVRLTGRVGSVQSPSGRIKCRKQSAGAPWSIRIELNVKQKFEF